MIRARSETTVRKNLGERERAVAVGNWGGSNHSLVVTSDGTARLTFIGVGACPVPAGAQVWTMRDSVSDDEYRGTASTYGPVPGCSPGAESDDDWTLSSSFNGLSFGGVAANGTRTTAGTSPLDEDPSGALKHLQAEALTCRWCDPAM